MGGEARRRGVGGGAGEADRIEAGDEEGADGEAVGGAGDEDRAAEEGGRAGAEGGGGSRVRSSHDPQRNPQPRATVNGRCASPAHLWLTGCRGEIETQLQRLPGFDKWIIEKESRPYIEALQDNKENLVYLTADAETILDELDPKKIYIIGGLVDRNRWKGITMKKANDQGIQSARLPIANYLRMSSSQVLTVNQVVEILLTFLETRDWKSAFFQVIPPRKRGEAEAEEVIEDEKTIDDADIVRVEDEVEGEDVDDEDIRVQKRQCIGESGTEGIEDENAEDSVRTVAASVDEAVNFEGNMHTKEATDGLRE
ncbi:uncharacterized protein [Elaeis guineensis]|uniref:tRNA (guanine(9)-N(1))-methyltransferase n=1 Tax=Elaeis guineensis var. tenera TaxID=51953 RepID=A0A6I9RKS9_ELAGV|nr:tRNA methyltransferase 10 homolog A isoform X2 [Elaeis guineensis]